MNTPTGSELVVHAAEPATTGWAEQLAIAVPLLRNATVPPVGTRVAGETGEIVAVYVTGVFQVVGDALALTSVVVAGCAMTWETGADVLPVKLVVVE